MKKVIIFIRPNRYHETKAALEKAGFSAISSVNVQGRGRNSVEFSPREENELKEYEKHHRFIPKKMIMIYIRDEDEKQLVDVVIDTNRTNHCGDGKIFILPIKTGFRIRSGESEEEAVV